MSSNEGEVVQLINLINPKNKENNIRGVEEWLGELEKIMKLTLFDILKKSMGDFKTKPRSKWLFDWPS